jgi:hypothetical protein
VLFLSLEGGVIFSNKFTGSIPDQLFTYYVENPLVIISINSGSWGVNDYLDRDRNLGN